MRVLNEYWVDENGEVPLPVDATALAEKLGAEVFAADLNDDLAGFIYKAPGQAAQITVNQNHHLHRRRFTCAHELGHFIERRGTPEIGYIDNRDTLSAHGTNPHEVYANTFAAALLMPEDELEYYAQDHDLYSLARLFRVSTESMEYRLRTLRIKVAV
ncbi:ImmA/IrrE family metallo-endopeptidase [Arthrobacter sp. FW305-BF8]|uniref:ImmA/IrrE family metallo-endopeptidase n=1 Tax=Arthrobacter sp. FW305-BF8 TaxID=2879617 RepID=UPI001F2C71AD|nr:ImmA/IrrE family metallo-endopeptidase [Arthrobacter sp. FW305-BF8]UKA55162.1 ImmA/IrrE family metallo-endopeptidase [Arthrobacter sp. FW305-BF8]